MPRPPSIRDYRAAQRRQRRAIYRLAAYLNGCIRLWEHAPVVFDDDGAFRSPVCDTIFADHVIQLAERIEKAQREMKAAPAPKLPRRWLRYREKQRAAQ